MTTSKQQKAGVAAKPQHVVMSGHHTAACLFVTCLSDTLLTSLLYMFCSFYCNVLSLHVMKLLDCHEITIYCFSTYRFAEVNHCEESCFFLFPTKPNYRTTNDANLSPAKPWLLELLLLRRRLSADVFAVSPLSTLSPGPRPCQDPGTVPADCGRNRSQGPWDSSPTIAWLPPTASPHADWRREEEVMVKTAIGGEGR